MEENQNPIPTPTPVVSDTPNPVPPATNPIKPASKFSIKAIIGTIIFLLLAGGATAGYVYREPILKLVSKPKPTPIVIQTSPTPTPDPTADWKTYKGRGFELKYPQNFIVDLGDVNNGGVSFYNEGSSESNSEGGSEWARFIVRTEESVNKDFYKNPDYLNAKKADNFSLQNRNSYSGNNVIIKSNDKIKFYVSCYLYSKQVDIDVCNQILSTFKFIEPTVAPTGIRLGCDGREGCYCYSDNECQSGKCTKETPDTENQINAGKCSE